MPKVKSAFDTAMSKMEEALADMQRHAAFARLNTYAGVENFASMSLVDENDGLFPCYILPKPPPSFYGREDEREMTKAHLARIDGSGTTQTVVLWGIGGSGKSSFAQQYAQIHTVSQSYDAIFWVHGETKVGTEESFIKIAQRLEIYPRAKSADKDFIIMKVNRWLAKTSKHSISRSAVSH